MKTIKDIEYSYNHLKQRLKERYNVDITRSEYDSLNNSVRKLRGSTKAVSSDNNGDQEVYKYSLTPTLKVLVVWSISKDRATTVLPMGG